MGKFQSSKVFDGFSTVFRQWKAETTHCRFVHGYGISFKVYFEGELDERNWVWDFGGMKRAKTKLMVNHLKHGWIICLIILIIAEDDPWKAFGTNG
jgi:6-pyruvoyltetrahydropterin/6-carboxytetrahydropterin synthase